MIETVLNVDFYRKKDDSTIFGGNQVRKRCKLTSIAILSLGDIHKPIHG